MENRSIAIDGPAGSGKSTIAKEIARQLGFNKLDTGAMYRAVTFAALDRGIGLDDEAAIDALAEQIEIRFTNGTGEDTRLTVDGQDASTAIRTPQVDANVSKVSAYPGVRAAMLIHQRRAAEDRDIVAEGRDIGTVVFPNAQVKIFLTADPRERARRRVLQQCQRELQPDGVCGHRHRPHHRPGDRQRGPSDPREDGHRPQVPLHRHHR